MLALDRAKRVQAALTKLVERRERIVQRAGSEFRLDLLAAIDQVDDETMSLVQRGLAMDRAEQGLQYALQLAIDERNEARRVSTRRSGSPQVPPLDVTFDPHEAETDAPPPPSSEDLGDELELSDIPVPPGVAELRYPEPGEPAITLADGTVVAAP
jgi:hypothetical protein